MGGAVIGEGRGDLVRDHQGRLLSRLVPGRRPGRQLALGGPDPAVATDVDLDAAGDRHVGCERQGARHERQQDVADRSVLRLDHEATLVHAAAFHGGLEGPLAGGAGERKMHMFPRAAFERSGDVGKDQLVVRALVIDGEPPVLDAHIVDHLERTAWAEELVIGRDQSVTRLIGAAPLEADRVVRPDGVGLDHVGIGQLGLGCLIGCALRRRWRSIAWARAAAPHRPRAARSR